jgi:hypothetical protein
MSTAQSQFTSSVSAAGIPTLSTLARLVPGLGVAATSYARSLSSIHWTKRSAPSAHSLISAVRSFAVFLGTISEQKAITLVRWLSQYETHLGTVAKKTLALRRVLGLGSGHVNNTTTTTTSGPSEASLLGTWSTKVGVAAFKTMARDVVALGKNDNGTDLSGELVKCQALRADISSIMAESPIPVASIEANWASALAEEEAAATNCIEAINSLNTSQLQEFLVSLQQGEASLGQVANAVSNIEVPPIGK